MLLAVGAPSGLLIVVQFNLMRRTRRLINPPLLGATVLLAIFGIYLLFVFGSASEQLRAAKQEFLDSIHALWKARAVAYDANAEESLYLLEGGALQTRHQEAFFSKTTQLLAGPPPAEAIAQAASGRFKDIKGFIGVELNNITYPGEREAALELLRTYVDYVDIDRKIRDLERAGRHAEAVVLCVGTAPGQSDWAFQRFDKALLKVIEINEHFFQTQIASAFSFLAWIHGHSRWRRLLLWHSAGSACSRASASTVGDRTDVRGSMALTANDAIVPELAAWQDRLALVSRNLGEINELPALQRIKARLQATPKFYAGETASRVADAHAALDELWKDYLLLNALLDDADALRKRSGIFHDHEAEIRELLHGRSITLPMAYVPLAERGLLTSAERADKVTPDELLAAMNAMFALAKDTILELDGAEPN